MLGQKKAGTVNRAQHYKEIAATVAAAIVALPFLYFVIMIPALLFLFFAGLLLVAALGERNASLLLTITVWSAIFYVGFRIFRYFHNLIRSSFFASYLPYLNCFKDLIASYNPADLPAGLQEEVTEASALLARTLLRTTDPYKLQELNLNHASPPRQVLQTLVFTPEHFRHLSLSQIQNTYPSPTTDLDRLEHELSEATAEEIKRRGYTIIGKRAETTPPLYHPYPDSTVHLSKPDRFRHLYIIGKTGTGKSNTLKHIIAQDLNQPKSGIIVFSPEDGIFESHTHAIPRDRQDDLIYFEPTDISNDTVIGFNPFDFTEAKQLPPYARDQYLTQKAGEVYTVFEQALGDLGVKMTTLMQNIVYALLQPSPPCSSNRPSRGPGARKPLRLYRNPS